MFRLCPSHFTVSERGFIGTFESGMHVFFPKFVLYVDTTMDCHLAYKPLGSSVSLPSLNYVQPRCRPNVYPSETQHNAQEVHVVED